MLTVILIDCAWGWVARTVEEHVYTGDGVGVFNLTRRAESDILVLGSSRAYINFVPNVLGDRVMNAGINGQGIGIARVLHSLSQQRGGLVLIDPMFFEDELPRLTAVHHLSGESPIIDDVIALGGWKEQLKLRSQLYRHAQAFLPALSNLGTTLPRWQARYGRLPHAARVELPSNGPQLMPDAWWWWQLDCLIKEVRAREATPMIVISPCANPRYNAFFDEIKTRHIAHIRIIDARAHFSPTPQFFADKMHLNQDAAATWSRSLAQQLRTP